MTYSIGPLIISRTIQLLHHVVVVTTGRDEHVAPVTRQQGKGRDIASGTQGGTWNLQGGAEEDQFGGASSGA